MSTTSHSKHSLVLMKYNLSIDDWKESVMDAKAVEQCNEECTMRHVLFHVDVFPVSINMQLTL